MRWGLNLRISWRKATASSGQSIDSKMDLLQFLRKKVITFMKMYILFFPFCNYSFQNTLNYICFCYHVVEDSLCIKKWLPGIINSNCMFVYRSSWHSAWCEAATQSSHWRGKTNNFKLSFTASVPDISWAKSYNGKNTSKGDWK